MLPPANRLSKKKEIERVFASPKSCRGNLLICKTALNGLNTARFCFIVSKRISLNATVRNKLKRHLRETIRHYLPRLKTGYDYIIITLPGLQLKSFPELKDIVVKTLSRCGMLI